MKLKTNVTIDPSDQAKLDRLNELTRKYYAGGLSDEELRERNELHRKYYDRFPVNSAWYAFSKWLLITGSVWMGFGLLSAIPVESAARPFGVIYTVGFLIFFLLLMAFWYQIAAAIMLLIALVKKNGRTRTAALYLIWSIGLFLLFWFVFDGMAPGPGTIFHTIMSV